MICWASVDDPAKEKVNLMPGFLARKALLSLGSMSVRLAAPKTVRLTFFELFACAWGANRSELSTVKLSSATIDRRRFGMQANLAP